ncbi:hypothetical protein ACFX13_044313 [Malus domestica]
MGSCKSIEFSTRLSWTNSRTRWERIGSGGGLMLRGKEVEEESEGLKKRRLEAKLKRNLWLSFGGFRYVELYI